MGRIHSSAIFVVYIYIELLRMMSFFLLSLTDRQELRRGLIIRFSNGRLSLRSVNILVLLIINHSGLKTSDDYNVRSINAF